MNVALTFPNGNWRYLPEKRVYPTSTKERKENELGIKCLFSFAKAYLFSAKYFHLYIGIIFKKKYCCSELKERECTPATWFLISIDKHN